MAAPAFDVGVARLALAEGATVFAFFFGNAVAAGVRAFLRFRHDQDLLAYLTAQNLKSFGFFLS